MKFHHVVGAALALALSATAANATDPGNDCGNQCGGGSTPTFDFTIGGGVIFGGLGGGQFQGDEGFILVEKTGYGGLDLNVSAAGGLCGIDCQDGSFTFDAWAGEAVKVQGGAFGAVSGQEVFVANQGQAVGAITFTMQKLTTD